VSSLSVCGRLNVAGHGEERASDTRSADRGALLPPVKAAVAVVLHFCRKGRINHVVSLAKMAMLHPGSVILAYADVMDSYHWQKVAKRCRCHLENIAIIFYNFAREKG